MTINHSHGLFPFGKEYRKMPSSTWSYNKTVLQLLSNASSFLSDTQLFPFIWKHTICSVCFWQATERSFRGVCYLLSLYSRPNSLRCCKRIDMIWSSWLYSMISNVAVGCTRLTRRARLYFLCNFSKHFHTKLFHIFKEEQNRAGLRKPQTKRFDETKLHQLPG